ncbi:hypothetical protein BN1708_006169 [Verticillium longisporum]|uniref:Endonuclease/exonuclease/phosphatase domain-containing protein n=2 Tax=Verticillium longisporum TaxID=100787 RepID=A0A0G4MHU0_VERLO|nr:hypothetical protein BN1708_006169 [Verticillium longisporum]
MKVSATLLSLAGAVAATTIAEINGNKFLSPLQGQNVTAVEGLVLAKGPNGVWIRSTVPDDDDLTSEAVYVFDRNVGANLAVGDIIKLDGTILEYRSTNTHLYLTELATPRNVEIVSRNNAVVAYVIGEDTPSPPTEQYTSLDGGDVFAVPNDVRRVSAVNPVLEPTKYGLDFWEALNGELVTVKAPVGVTRPNQFGDTWVLGTWTATGRNEHGGISLLDKDANPETVLIGSPLDGSRNPESKMGDKLADITGVVTYSFGFYRVLPLTAVKVESESSAETSPTTLESSGDCRGITFGSYNVENLWPGSEHLPDVADQIVDYLKTPDLIFLQEVQDSNGPTNDLIVSANITLATLAAAIKEKSGVVYEWLNVDPIRNQDGGQPGGNIQTAYLYRPDVLEVYKPNQGGSLDSTVVVDGPALSFNPGRIDVANDAAWANSLVLAKGPNGVWIRSTVPDDDDLTSEAVYVFDRNVAANLAVGDIIKLDGTILEYRSTNTHLYLTELATPRNVEIVSRNNAVVAYVIGEDTPSPPTEQYTSLDGGDVFAVPNDRQLRDRLVGLGDERRQRLDEGVEVGEGAAVFAVVG